MSDRKKQSAKNSIVGIASFLTKSLLSFVVKTVFIYVLGAELLGLNSLFSNVLTILSLAELGIGSAIVFAMYKPIAEENYDKVNALVKFYKKVYYTIAVVMIVLGVALLPFLKYIINADNTLSVNIYIVYVMFLLNNIISYFAAHRNALIFASQRNDILTEITMVVGLISSIIQIVVIFLVKDYYVYYSITLFATALENICVYIASNKIYKNLDLKNAKELNKEEKQSLFKDFKGMLFQKVGGAIISGTDNIIISAFINLTVLGAYSNYILITSSIGSAIWLIVNSIKASVGNLIATRSSDEVEQIQHKLMFGYFWLNIFCSTCLFCLLQHFVTIWLPDEYMLSFFTFTVIIAGFYIDKTRTLIITFRDAAGLFRYKKWSPVLEALTNLLVSIILVKNMGLPGVVLGTIIGNVAFPLWVEPWVVYKHYYHKSSKGYWKKWITYFGVGTLIAIFTFFICALLPNFGLLWFVLKCGICLVVPNLIMLLVFCRTQEFKYYLNLVKSLIKRKKKSEE